ncbi:MAG: hypothetical protein WC365_02310 [Candidatus Babeliales bacterium]
MNIAKKIVCCCTLVMSLCGAMSFGMASKPVVPVAQIQKELSAEKAQWAYVQKVLTDDLQLSKTVINKLHRVGAYCVGMIGGAATGYAVMECLDKLQKCANGRLGNPNSDVVFFLDIISGLASAIWIANTVDKLLENKPAVCAKALTSFINKWPEHKAQTPESLQGTFDILYANRQTKNGGLTDKQAQTLVEGILALSVVAQGA